jgi:hypothetical protein
LVHAQWQFGLVILRFWIAVLGGLPDSPEVDAELIGHCSVEAAGYAFG